ncbi:SDR family NAD(P)-dependent oxidoreductase [Devosia sp. SL43]|uniref:SDR family NAD(P)-dependent oxidoreductase n=1 Tax=Devosia sp. SL43 TaxID=2806348 RepID=UPI001F17770C|nr:SDR family oxidoreductase [Devosia sp. SL43]UJW86816.1 SDR family oxidoreductase [Devosia sp. SL43]
MLLENKIAIIHGAGGQLGGATARQFARDGARLFLAGRTLSKVQAVADEINVAGGNAEAAEVDALDEAQARAHADAVVTKAGRIDITFNAISIRGDLQGTRLIDMPTEDVLTPILTGARTHLLTALAAARHMVKQRSGVILTLSSTGAHLSGRDQMKHSTGGFGVACSTIEALSRTLAAELGPHGIRVVCLRSEAITELWPMDSEHAEMFRDFKTYMTAGTILGRTTSLAELANGAALAASDRSSAISGAILNLTCGSVMDGD